MSTGPGRGRGRPRSADADQSIVAATVGLLAERGYAALTIEAVAARAGVSRPTVYRRWPAKDDLVVYALVQAVSPLIAPDTGDAVRDLGELATTFVIRLAQAPLGRIVLGVHAESGRNPRLAAPLRDRYLRPRDAVINEVIGRGRQQGGLRQDLTADAIRDLVFGPLIYHWLITGSLDRATADALVTASYQAIGAAR